REELSMALIILTQTPKKLLAAINQGITDNSIRTWCVRDNGFAHDTSDGQWIDQARLFPSVIENTALVMKIVGPPKGKLLREVYAIYLGRFSEMLLAHFDTLFTNIQIT